MVAVRVLAVFQGFSNLPEDRFINTFHFNNPLATWPGDASTIMFPVELFYTEPRSSTNPISSYLSPAIMRTVTLLGYDLSDPEPREPEVTSFVMDAAPAQAGAGCPEEVAVTLSYHGAPPITARRRGRIYIGPLGSDGTAITPASAAAYSSVSSVLRTDLADAAESLVSDSGGTWCIRSTVPTENFVPIVGGWIDNAPDTQRRRGPDTSIRTLWP